MYRPRHFDETRPQVLHALMREHPLGALVARGAHGLAADHVPWLLDAHAGPHGTLRGHVARSNPVCEALARPAQVLVIFQGPQTYVSPNWYPSKHQHGKAVPTWNYAAVHAHGTPRLFDDAGRLLELVTELTRTHEASQAHPWQVGDAPEAFTARMLEAIVGVEIPIDRLEGKWKVSQNRPRPDRLGVAAGLEGRGEALHARAMASLVRAASRD